MPGMSPRPAWRPRVDFGGGLRSGIENDTSPVRLAGAGGVNSTGGRVVNPASALVPCVPYGPGATGCGAFTTGVFAPGRSDGAALRNIAIATSTAAATAPA